MGFGVGCGEVEFLAIQSRPDRLVADSGHFAGFFEFIRVVFRSERVITLTVNVHAVGHFIVVEPAPDFFVNGGVHGLLVG